MTASRLEVRNNTEESHAWVENDHLRLDDFDREYVAFSGYFGKFGPELFAAAPELLEALEVMTAFAEGVIARMNLTDTNGICPASRAIIAKAKGGAS